VNETGLPETVEKRTRPNARDGLVCLS